ncbi:hypothetical protein HRbin21_00034 [bacterium HR21]|nr:hypothetical protein HRbin21_00034 [bacterium HR21]
MGCERFLAAGLAISVVGALLLQAGHHHSEAFSPRVEASCWVCVAGPLVSEVPPPPPGDPPRGVVQVVGELPFITRSVLVHPVICWRAPPGTDYPV